MAKKKSGGAKKLLSKGKAKKKKAARKTKVTALSKSSSRKKIAGKKVRSAAKKRPTSQPASKETRSAERSTLAGGTFPVPAPAVAELLKGFSIYSTEVEGELITPTGAAIISTVCDNYGAIPEIKVEYVGYGAGSREYKDFPNVLRMMVGETTGETCPSSGILTDKLTLIETNIDDISPQILGYVMDRAFELGALDCWFTPIQMKKNRPATTVSILCQPNDKDTFDDLLYRETSTLGVRIREVERECLSREFVKVETQFGSVDVKIARRGGEIVNAMPEFEQVKKLALENGVSFMTVRVAVWARLNTKERSSGADA